MAPAVDTAVAVEAAKHMKQDARRAREFYRYLEPSNLIAPSLRRKNSTFNLVDHIPSLSSALTPYCQLTALRCNVQKAMLNVMDRDVMYFLAEANRPRSDTADKTRFHDFVEDPILRSCSNTPMAGRICELTVRTESAEAAPMFTIPDLLESSFAHLPVVSGPPYYRFYAGTPITTVSGIHIGSLAIMDIEPRPNGLTEDEEDFLSRTAAQIMTYLEVNRQAIEGRRSRRLASGLECFIAGKRSLSDELHSGLPSNSPKRRARPTAYGIANSPQNSTDIDTNPRAVSIGTDASQSPPVSPKHIPSSQAHRKLPLQTNLSDMDSSEQSSDNERKGKPIEDDSRFHAKTFARAANLLREAFSDLGEDGSVVFFNLKGRLERNARSSLPNGTPSSISSPVDSSFPKTNLKPVPTSRRTLVPILAYSTNLENFGAEDVHTDKALELTEDTIKALIKRYPGGKLWSFDDGNRGSSSEDDSTPLPKDSGQRRRSSRRVKTEELELKAAFPHARQLLFTPVWDADIGSFAHVVFLAAALETRTLSAVTELPFLNSFCSTVMAECSRLDTMTADKQKSDFVGTISHEMRSPLHGILASVEFLADTDLTGFQQSLIDTIHSCTRTATDTIQHVLDFSKINSFQKQWQANNKRNSKGTNARRKNFLDAENTVKTLSHGAPPLLQLFGVTDIGAVTEEVIEGLCLAHNFSSNVDMTDLSREARGRGRETAPPKDVEVLLDIQKADWTFITQPGAVRRIVLNLMGNALKYTKQGSINARLALKTIEVEDTSIETMVFSVEDTGCGISEDFLNSKLFIPFAQENALAPGTGLGLSIVQGITVMLGGHIEVQSTVGKGTTVQVSLPLKRPLPGQASTTNTPHSGNTTNSSGSGHNESIALLHNHGADAMVSLYRPHRLHRDSLAHIISGYVKDWYGLDLVDSALLGQANIIITEEQDLESLLDKMVGTPGSRPALVVLCDVSSRHSATYTSSLERRINGTVEFVAKPVGPYKLAKSIRLALQKLKAIRPQFAKVTTLPVLDEQRSPAISTPGEEDDNDVEEIADNLGHMDFSLGSQDHVAQVVQATETFAVSQLSANAQMAITSPDKGEMSSPMTYEDGAFPFPSQMYENDKSNEAQPTNGLSQGRKTSKSSIHTRARKLSVAKQLGSLDELINPRILLVDDNKINLKLLETFLKGKRKYTKVDTAEDGQKAVDAYTRCADGEQYEIIFMDISMPIMNGFEATKAIRNIEEGDTGQSGDAMIIALTGLASGRDQAEGFDAGVDIYLTKPVSFKEVGKLLDNWEAHQSRKAKTIESGEALATPQGALAGKV